MQTDDYKQPGELYHPVFSCNRESLPTPSLSEKLYFLSSFSAIAGPRKRKKVKICCRADEVEIERAMIL